MDYLAMQAVLRPGKVAVCDLTHSRKWSWLEFDRFVGSCVAVLQSGGIKTGDRVACLSKNRAEYVALHHACSRLGALFVPLNWRLTPTEIEVLLDDCKPNLLFGDEQAQEKRLDHQAIDQLISRSAEFAPATGLWADPASPSLILYTSGTTGKPKGALLSENNLAETAINFTLLGNVKTESAFLCDAPMFHVIGLVTNIRPALLNGASILISDGFQPERTLQRLMDPALAVTHYFCVPQMAKALRESPEFSPAGLSRLTAIFTGGAPHSESEIRQWLADGILLADGFGMSEAGTVFGMPVDADRIREKAGSVGVPTPRVRARISDDNDSEAEPGNPGELQLQGDNICQGYWQREEDSANARTRDGWFRTGDIATVDEDGFYRIVGRRKDMYISGGENVYPAEVEAAVMASGLVAECAVVGVPDPRWGEAGALVLVRATGGECEPEYLGQTILDSLKGKLAPYKIPRHLEWTDALPKNANGKVLKHVLRDRLINRQKS